MLPTTSSFEQRALNRVTFGARDTDVAYAQSIGWSAWVAEQLNAPPGDDAAVAQHLAAQTMPISYSAVENQFGGWPAVNESRPLTRLNAEIETLWDIQNQSGRTLPFAEVARVGQELAAATWIRNTHARYQVREFLTDFWHNHFNIGKDEDQYSTISLPVYDRLVIRPNVLGNFRQMLEATAMSAAMLVYLDNFVSAATTPNENYAREIIELHTLGAGAYLGKAADLPPPMFPNSVADGFTDQDIVQASRALSGWTLEYGQRINGVPIPRTGKFLYNPAAHNANAGKFMNVDLSLVFGDMAQGRRVIEVLAHHPATATFVCTKLCRRIFGDTPPEDVVNRAVAAWTANVNANDQIKRVMEAILLGGNEIGNLPPVKQRRPYERLIALFRTTDVTVTAHRSMVNTFDPVRDGLFAWGAPNGRPDVNGYWLSTGTNLTAWNLALQWPYVREIQTTLAAQTPASAATSAINVVEHWVGRMVGHQIQTSTMQALVADQAGFAGVPASYGNTTATVTTGNANRVENAYRRLVGLISTTEEFSYR